MSRSTQCRLTATSVRACCAQTSMLPEPAGGLEAGRARPKPLVASDRVPGPPAVRRHVAHELLKRAYRNIRVIANLHADANGTVVVDAQRVIRKARLQRREYHVLHARGRLVGLVQAD